MRLTEVRFIQPGVEFRGQTKLQLTTRLDKVEVTVGELGLEVLDVTTGITHWYPQSMVRQAVALKSSLACPHCGELFKSTGGMGNHIRIRHPGPVEPVAVLKPEPAKMPPRKKAANG